MNTWHQQDINMTTIGEPYDKYFLAAKTQLNKFTCPSVCLSVCLSVCVSVIKLKFIPLHPTLNISKTPNYPQWPPMTICDPPLTPLDLLDPFRPSWPFLTLFCTHLDLLQPPWLFMTLLSPVWPSLTFTDPSWPSLTLFEPPWPLSTWLWWQTLTFTLSTLLILLTLLNLAWHKWSCPIMPKSWQLHSCSQLLNTWTAVNS